MLWILARDAPASTTSIEDPLVPLGCAGIDCGTREIVNVLVKAKRYQE